LAVETASLFDDVNQQQEHGNRDNDKWLPRRPYSRRRSLQKPCWNGCRHHPKLHTFRTANFEISSMLCTLLISSLVSSDCVLGHDHQMSRPMTKGPLSAESMIDVYLLASLGLGSDNFVNLVSTWKYLLGSLRLGWDNCINLVTTWRAVTKNCVNLKRLDSMPLSQMMQVRVLTERRISKSLIGALSAQAAQVSLR
jgi:hypothetical protein